MIFAHPIVVVGLLAVCALAMIGVVKPFWGLLVLMAIHFVQPAELFPVLAPFRIELVYAILLLLSFTFYLLSERRRLLASPIFTGALVLLAAATLTIPFAIWKGGALNGTILLAKLIVILFLIGHLVDSNDRLKKLLWIVCGLFAWFAASGFLAFRSGDFVVGEQDLNRAQGLTSVVSNPNELAGLIVGLFPFLIVLFICTRNLLARVLLLGCAAIGVATMVLTGSRASMLSLVVITIYYSLRSKRRVLVLASVAVLACAIWLGMPRVYQQRFATVKQYAEGGELDASNQLRLQVWKAGWHMYLDHPILGVGTGQFPTAYGLIYSPVRHGGWYNPHNLFLQVICELGLIGLFAFGYFFKQIVGAIRSVLRLRGDPRFALNYQVAVACNAMLLGVLAVSVVGHTLYRPYWYILGGLAAANRMLVDRMQAREDAEASAAAQESSVLFETRTADGVLVPERRV
jgi:putative inorganic carbon (HCO3(-)) transporter